MDSIDEIAERIKEVMHQMGESPTSFADKLQVQRSSISHILSGRNKPSLDFVLKLLHAYPSVSADYILFGKTVVEGRFPSSLEERSTSDDRTNEGEKLEENVSKISKKVKQVVLFYEDGTFSHYTPDT